MPNSVLRVPLLSSATPLPPDKTRGGAFITVLAIRLIGLTAVVCATFGSAAVAQPSDAVREEPCPATAARMVLWHTGRVTLNGAEVSTENLGSAVAALVPRPTEVCFTQENPHDELDLGRLLGQLISLRIPLSIYSDTSFLHRMTANSARTPNNRWRGP